jgi:hypothetical protein
MKTPIYNPGTMKIIQVITILFGLQINILNAADPLESDPGNKLLTCVTCSNTEVANQKEVLSDELNSLAPTVPSEATFSEEETGTETFLEPTTPKEASFDDDPEFINTYVLEYLTPTTPAEAGFND